MTLLRAKTRVVEIGNLAIGGDNPIQVQSMTNTRTDDVAATLAQIKRLEEAGCEIIRVTVPDEKSLSAIPALKAGMKVPLVADVHFRQDIALSLLDTEIDKIRINPGNIGGAKKFREVVKKAAGKGKTIRIGINSGSVEADLLEKYGHPTPEAMVESALRALEICDAEHFSRVVVSIKASDLQTAYESAIRFSKLSDTPQHLGITESGAGLYGSIKSSAGLGAILLSGVGDTIRVSLTGDPVPEVGVAFDILKATGRRIVGPELISCPTCGRIQINLEPLAEKVADFLKSIKKPIKVSLLGCVVNGPGEAKEADIGIAGGKGYAILYRRGVKIREVNEADLLDALREEIEKF